VWTGSPHKAGMTAVFLAKTLVPSAVILGLDSGPAPDPDPGIHAVTSLYIEAVPYG